MSGFGRKHGTTATAEVKVINDITEALDDEQYCLSLFIDFSKTIHRADHYTSHRLLFFLNRQRVFVRYCQSTMGSHEAQSIAFFIYLMYKWPYFSLKLIFYIGDTAIYWPG